MPDLLDGLDRMAAIDPSRALQSAGITQADKNVNDTKSNPGKGIINNEGTCIA